MARRRNSRQRVASDEQTQREFHLPSADSLLPYITAAVVGLALVLIVWAAAVFLNRSSRTTRCDPASPS